MTRQKSRPKTAPAPAMAPHSRLPHRLLPAILIVAAGAWAFSNSLDGAFVLDDVRAILRNETIRTLSPLTAALSPPGESTVAGRPVANISFALNYAAGAYGVRGYHLANLAIHLAAALTLFGIVRRTLLTPHMRDRFGAAATPVALATALVWVVHPLQTESVTYVVQRVESLMGLFYLLTLYFAIRAADGTRAPLWTAAAAAACALGMATKEVMVTAPLAVALWDSTYLRGRGPRWTLLGALAATWVVFAILVGSEYRAASIALDAGTSWRYLLTQSAVIAHYVRLSIVPAPLVFLYDWPLASSIGDVLMPALLVTAAVAATVFAIVRRHPVGFAGGVFFLVLAPTSSVIPVITEVAAEHRMYLPLAAIAAVAAAGIHALWMRAAPRGGTAAAVGLTAVLVLTYGLVTRDRNRDYMTEEALWRATVEAHPSGGRARVAYGTALVAARRLPEAAEQFRAAVRLNDADGVAHTRLGSVLAAQNRFDEALPHYERAVALRPDDVDANRALGQLYMMQGRDAAAISHLSRAAEGIRTDPMLFATVAALLVESKDPLARNPVRAVDYAQRAVTLTGRRDPLLLELLSGTLAASRRLPDAAATAREALPLARAQGDAALAGRLEYRIDVYERGAR